MTERGTGDWLEEDSGYTIQVDLIPHLVEQRNNWMGDGFCSHSTTEITACYTDDLSHIMYSLASCQSRSLTIWCREAGLCKQMAR